MELSSTIVFRSGGVVVVVVVADRSISMLSIGIIFTLVRDTPEISI